jgi:hypothetical protein
MCSAQGSCTYTPSSGYTGPDQFTYTVTDGTLVTTTAMRVSFASSNDAAAVTGTAHITVVAAPTTPGANGSNGSNGSNGTDPGAGSATGPATLSRTGADAGSTVLFGLGLVTVGVLARSAGRRRPRRS